MTGKQHQLRCVVCNLALESKEDIEFAKDDANYPGILGPVHQKCYDKVCKERPETPWEDPISGEVNWDAMHEDLGVENPEAEEWGEDDYGF